MKYLLIAVLLLSGCKASKTTFQEQEEIKSELKKELFQNTQTSESTIETAHHTEEIETVRYEPVYFRTNGKDTVVLKPKIIRITKVAENKNEHLIESASIDNLSLRVNSEATNNIQNEVVKKPSPFPMIVLRVLLFILLIAGLYSYIRSGR